MLVGGSLQVFARFTVLLIFPVSSGAAFPLGGVSIIIQMNSDDFGSF